MKTVILNNKLTENVAFDELDNKIETEAVTDVLEDLGFDVEIIEFGFDIQKIITQLQKFEPKFVFNLVESIEGKGNLIYFASAVLDSLKIPYTGCNTEALFNTSNKLITKQILRIKGIKTADWFCLRNKNNQELINKTVIVKSVWEHASLGIDDFSIFKVNSKQDIEKKLEDKKEKGEFFAEEFIDGREFNVSMLEYSSGFGVEVLPIAEILFNGYSNDMSKVVNYKAKWDENSFEYKNTVRNFEFDNKDAELLEKLIDISKKVWDVFELTGFARVDFRVDKTGEPFVLEINANPCISPDSGFVAACEKTGILYNEMIERIIEKVRN